MRSPLSEIGWSERFGSTIGRVLPRDASHGWAVLGTVLAFMAFTPEWSSAQDAEAGDRAEARRLFEGGVEALDDQRYAEASELFTQSLAIRESAIARFDRALALRGAGRYRAALADLELVLEQTQAARHRDLQTQATRMRDELRESLARVEIRVVGGADTLTVNDEALDPDETQTAGVDPGTVRIRVERAGFEPVLRELVVEPGQSASIEIRADETPIAASVRIETSPEHAEIEWAGRVVGAGHATVEEVLREPHAFELVVRADGFETDERRITLGPGANERVSVALAEVGATPLRQRWWLWTAILVGAGALAAGLFLGLRQDFPIETGTLDFSQAVLMVTP